MRLHGSPRHRDCAMIGAMPGLANRLALDSAGDAAADSTVPGFRAAVRGLSCTS